MQVHTYYYTGVHTPMGLPTGSSQAEDFRTEQLSAFTQYWEVMLQKEELFSLSWVKGYINSLACISVVPLFACPWFFFLTCLVALLMLLWCVCWQYILRAHLKEVKQYERYFRKKLSKEFWSSKYDHGLLEMHLWMIYCAIDLEGSRRSTRHQLTHSQIRVEPSALFLFHIDWIVVYISHLWNKLLNNATDVDATTNVLGLA